jgi:hypothetical protein
MKRVADAPPLGSHDFVRDDQEQIFRAIASGFQSASVSQHRWSRPRMAARAHQSAPSSRSLIARSISPNSLMSE